MKLPGTRSLLPAVMMVGIALGLGGCDYLGPGLIDPGHGGGGEGREARTFALDFNGSGDYVLVRNSPHLQLSRLDGFTIDAWVRSDSWGHWNWIASHARSNANNDFLFGFDQGRLRFITDDLGNDLMASTRLETGRWHHVAGVQDRSSGLMIIYIDGEPVARRQLTRGSEETDADLFIGARESFGTDRPVEFFDGILHEVRIWRSALTHEQITRVMRERNPELDNPDRYWGAGLNPTFIARWPMNEGEGDIVQDASGNGHTGRIYGADWTIAPDPMK